MKIPVPLQPLLNPPQREVTSLLKQLQVGQILPARVLAELKPDLVRLRIATTELLARTPLSLKTGTHLKLEVIKQQQVPELRILREHPKTPVEQRAQAVRTALARQLAPVEVRRVVAELGRAATEPRAAPTGPRAPAPGPGAAPAGPRAVPTGPRAPAPGVHHAAGEPRNNPDTLRPVEALRRFESVLRDAGIKPAQLTPRQVQRAVMQSGVFHEARMVSGTPPDTGDMKLRLLQLLSVLTRDLGRSTPSLQTSLTQQTLPVEDKTRIQPEIQAQQARGLTGDSLLNRLIRLIEGSVSRIQLQQSAALPVEESPRQAWQIDLPVQLREGTEDVTLRIERDGENNDQDGGPGWSVNLAFQFDTIGTLQCRIGLSGERVATTFWCETAATHARVEERLPVLQQALEAQGLEVVHLSGVIGAPSEPLIHVPMPDSLLDERA